MGETIQGRSELVVNTPGKDEARTGEKVETEGEVTKLNREVKTVTAVDHKTGEERTYDYDKLIIATGASPIVPPVEGIHLKNIFVMRTPDEAAAIREAVDAGEVKSAGVAEAGVIGPEGAESLPASGVWATGQGRERRHRTPLAQ